MNIVSVKDLTAVIRQERKRRKWTQAELAEQSGVSRDWIIELEKGKPNVSLTLVLRTLKALQLPISVGESKGDPASPSPASTDQHSTNTINLDDILKRNISRPSQADQP